MTVDPGQDQMTLSERVACQPLDSVGAYCYGCLEAYTNRFLAGEVTTEKLAEFLDELGVAWLNRVRPLSTPPPAGCVDEAPGGTVP